jgi:acyl carrier protein phosphodiesterase
MYLCPKTHLPLAVEKGAIEVTNDVFNTISFWVEYNREMVYGGRYVRVIDVEQDGRVRIKDGQEIYAVEQEKVARIRLVTKVRKYP